MRQNRVNIWSKGEVASYLIDLAKKGQIKECKHMMLEHGHAGAYYPNCIKDWASWVGAHNVSIDITAYSGPSHYSWPKCPEDCPHFESVEKFLLSVSRNQYDELLKEKKWKMGKNKILKPILRIQKPNKRN